MRFVQLSALAAIACAGCARQAKPVLTPTSASSRGAAQPAPATSRPANHSGSVFIVEYHKITKQEARWDRSESSFRGDLERLYKMGFRPVTLRDYVENKMSLPRGASPVVVTFDDANPTQFQLEPNGQADPHCAVGLWQAFAAQHPDFPLRATFFVLADVMWGQSALRDTKVDLLKSWGCEIGNHTMTHPQLSKLSDDRVKQEIAGAIDFLASKGVPQPVSIALPYGLAPKNRTLLQAFEFHGKSYQMYAALLVGANPAPSPTSPKLNRYRIPRIQGIDGPYGIRYWLDEVEKGRVKPYVQ